jgi:hypothetical protein
MRAELAPSLTTGSARSDLFEFDLTVDFKGKF